jgi:hypothetical protein
VSGLASDFTYSFSNPDTDSDPDPEFSLYRSTPLPL